MVMPFVSSHFGGSSGGSAGRGAFAKIDPPPSPAALSTAAPSLAAVASAPA
jgi:hypothetical protein